MSDQRSKAASTFGKDFMREVNTIKPLPKNSMVESQKNAQSRPIPTFASGGPVKKAVDTYRRADQAADAKIVAKVVAKKDGGVAKFAMGGVGKKRHNVPDPGRGKKLSDGY